MVPYFARSCFYFARALASPLTRMLFRLPTCLNHMPPFSSTAARNHTGLESTAVIRLGPDVHLVSGVRCEYVVELCIPHQKQHVF